MNILKTFLAELQIKIFSDPIHYYGEYSANRNYVMCESDNKFLKTYAIIARTRNFSDEIPEEYDSVDQYLADILNMLLSDIVAKRVEIDSLEVLERTRMFIYADAYSEYMVPDSVFLDDLQIYEYLKIHEYILIGPEVNHNGKYIKYEGTEVLRLDFFGNVLEKANFKYFSQNSEYINDTKVFVRHIAVSNEEEGIYESLSFYRIKDKGNLLADSDEYDSNPYMYNGELLDTILFVADLDNNIAIAQKIRQYINDLDTPGVFQIEERLLNKVKYENPLKFTIIINE